MSWKILDQVQLPQTGFQLLTHTCHVEYHPALSSMMLHLVAMYTVVNIPVYLYTVVLLCYSSLDSDHLNYNMYKWYMTIQFGPKMWFVC